MVSSKMHCDLSLRPSGDSFEDDDDFDDDDDDDDYDDDNDESQKSGVIEDALRSLVETIR